MKHDYGAPKHVYFAERGGQIKIGCSGNVPARMRSLHAVLLGAFPGGFEAEKATHERFAALRIEGEWFRDDPLIRAFIGRLPAFVPPRFVPVRTVLGSRDVAHFFSVSASTVGRWADEGLLPHFRTPGGQRRFHREDVEKFIKDQEPAA